uniref:Transposase domain-containing protein n=1 Tax=Cacopsylla melanoneura TaxID=428564 RepID=A0A8D8X8P8_9HEMI
MPKRKYFSDLSKRQKIRRVIEQSLTQEHDNPISTGAELSFLENTIIGNDQPQSSFCENDTIDNDQPHLSHFESESCEVQTQAIPMEPETHVESSLKNKLKSWAQECHIPLIHLSKLLNILKPYHNDLPRDARTLLHTPRSTNVEEMGSGQYVHFGMKEALIKLFTSNMPMQEYVGLSVNIDGLPPFKSSNKALWPILISVSGCPTVSIVGVYYGSVKPDVNLFLTRFVEEFNVTHNTGVEFKNRMFFPYIKHIICDAPAKSYVLCVKGHTGYYSCTKCHIEGESRQGTMCFPGFQLRAPRRSDNEYRFVNLENDFQNALSPLRNLDDFNFIKHVPHDYMHLICLGLVKKIISLWFRGNLKYRINTAKATEISSQLELIAKYTPSEFARKPRSIASYKFWKATEFRQFLLFTGYAVLQNVIDPSVFENFKSLMICIKLFCNHEECYEDANEMAKYFVKTFSVIYGVHKMSHNVHGLLHLKDDVVEHGSLDNFSAFKFENFLYSLKSILRKSNQPLEQIYNREWEARESPPRTAIIEEGPKPNSLHTSGLLAPSTEQREIIQFSRAIIKGLKVNTKSPRERTFSLRNGDIVKIVNIIVEKNKRKVAYQKYCRSNVFESPCPSSAIGFFSLSNLKEDIFECEFHDIEFKYYLMPHKSIQDKFFAMRMSVQSNY